MNPTNVMESNPAHAGTSLQADPTVHSLQCHSSVHSLADAQLCTPSRAGTGLQMRPCDATTCSVPAGTDPHKDATCTVLYGSGCRHRPARSRLLHRAVQLQLTSRIRTAVPEIARRRATPTLRDHHRSMQAPVPCAAPCPPRNRDGVRVAQLCGTLLHALAVCTFISALLFNSSSSALSMQH